MGLENSRVKENEVEISKKGTGGVITGNDVNKLLRVAKPFNLDRSGS